MSFLFITFIYKITIYFMALKQQKIKTWALHSAENFFLRQDKKKKNHSSGSQKFT